MYSDPVPLADFGNPAPRAATFNDIEAQRARKIPITPLRHTATAPVKDTAVSPPAIRRRDTLLPQLKSATRSPTLTAEPTWRVDQEALHGYPSLAAFLGGKRGYSVYRRFAYLNSRNLLYQQAKLTRLEHELKDLENSFADDLDLHCTVDHILSETAGEPGRKLKECHEKIYRELDKYNKLLVDQRHLHELPEPDSTIVDSIDRFLALTEGVPRPFWLEHPESTTYAVWRETGEPLQSDLVALHPSSASQDRFTRLVTGRLLDLWQSVSGIFAVGWP